MKNVRRAILIISLLFIIGGALSPHAVALTTGNAPNTLAITWWALGIVLLVGSLALWVVCGAFKFGWGLGGQIAQPIPDLASIELQLRREGYNPTIADCAAVQDSLRHNRNEAFVVLGGVVVAGHFLGQAARTQ